MASQHTKNRRPLPGPAGRSLAPDVEDLHRDARLLRLGLEGALVALKDDALPEADLFSLFDLANKIVGTARAIEAVLEKPGDTEERQAEPVAR